MKTFDLIKQGGECADLGKAHQWLDRSVRYVTNGRYTLTLTRVVQKRTLSQNRLMWLWFACIEAETGQPSQDVHDYYCSKLLQREIINPLTGEITKVCGGTSTMNTAQMTQFLNQVQADAATELGITLPLPSDLGYDEFRLQYERYVP